MCHVNLSQNCPKSRPLLWMKVFKLIFCKEKNYVFADLRSFTSAKIIWFGNFKSANCRICGRSANLRKNISPRICTFADLRFGKIIWHPPTPPPQIKVEEQRHIHWTFMLLSQTFPREYFIVFSTTQCLWLWCHGNFSLGAEVTRGWGNFVGLFYCFNTLWVGDTPAFPPTSRFKVKITY